MLIISELLDTIEIKVNETNKHSAVIEKIKLKYTNKLHKELGLGIKINKILKINKFKILGEILEATVHFTFIFNKFISDEICSGKIFKQTGEGIYIRNEIYKKIFVSSLDLFENCYFSGGGDERRGESETVRGDVEMEGRGRESEIVRRGSECEIVRRDEGENRESDRNSVYDRNSVSERENRESDIAKRESDRNSVYDRNSGNKELQSLLHHPPSYSDGNWVWDYKNNLMNFNTGDSVVFRIKRLNFEREIVEASMNEQGTGPMIWWM